MNILFNKKILFSLLLSSSLLIQGAYAQNNPSSNVYGTLDIITGSSLDTPELQVDASGSVTVGNNLLSDGTGVLCIKADSNDTSDNPHSTVSNIQKTLTVNIDGNFLNEKTMNCEGNNTNRANVTNNKGLFINQGYINVGQYATLTCGKFPGNDNMNEYDSSWYKGSAFITNHNNYGGIMNGCCPFDTTKTPTFTYGTSGHEHEITKDNPDSDSKYTGNSGTITFIPGATCNDGNGSNGEIDGGTIDLTQYVQIKSSSTGNTHTDGTDTLSLQFDTNSNLSKAQDNLKINIKNAEIKLFDGNVKNSNTPQQGEITDKLELSQLKLENFTSVTNPSASSMQNMFANLTFENCRCQIPDDEGNGAATYKAQKGTEPPISTLDASKLKGHNGSSETDNSLIIFNSPYRYKIITDGSSSSSNFDIVKKLFANISSIAESTNDNNSTHKKIYHELGERNTTTGNKYKVWINNGSTDGIDNDVSNDPISQPEDGLVLWSTNGGGAGNKYTFSKLFDEYMNLNCYIDVNNISGVADNLDSDLSNNNLKLFLKTSDSNTDPTKYEIYMQLANGTGTNNNVVIQSQMSNLDYSDNTKPNGTLTDFPGTLELVMKNPWIHTKLGDSETDKITYNGTLSRVLPDITDGNSDADKKKRTTRIVQEYDGPAFSNFKINSNVTGTDVSNTKKDDLTSSDILEYEVVSNNPSSNNMSYSKFSAHDKSNASNPLVADKFTIGKANADKTFTVSSDNETQSSNILTQNFTVNDKATYNLKGHITVRNLKGSDL